VSRARAYLLAARPPTLLAVVSPVLVGSGLAADDGVFRWDAFAVTLIAAIAINIGVNYANDASDARRGADTPDRIGPTRAVASGLLSPAEMWTGVAFVFGIATGCGIYLSVIAGWPILAIGAASLVAAVGYTGGPWPYGYRALGEPFVFVFFGLVATVGSRYVHDRSAPLDAWLLALPVGFLVTAILVANNIRDIETDRRAGKRTLAVLLGRSRTRLLYGGLVGGAFAVLGIVTAAGWVPRLCSIGLLALPLAVIPVRTVSRHTAGPELVSALKANARIHVLTGALIALGAAL
jgi:1,4-dihydroxy-2-naphthoate octaprenyltransferase